MGELDRIAYQVENDLPQANGIARNPFRHIGGDVAQKLQALFVGAQCQCLQSFFQAIPQIEVNRFQLNFAGFDFGKVQNVVDHRKQSICRQLNRFEILPLFRIEFRVERQLRHPNHAV